MQDSESSWTRLDVLGVSVFLAMVLFWAWTVAHRITYPYDLEWMEGGMLIHALRVQESLGLYVTPSSDFIPYIYPPLYPWILAGLSEIFTLGYPLGRGVSVVGTLMATSAIVIGLRNERVNRSIAFLSAAVFLSTFEDSGTFFDLTRADSLMMGFLAWTIVLVRMDWLRCAGLLCWLAFLTKHNAAIVGFPIAFWLLKEHGFESAMKFAIWSVLPALCSIGILQATTDGLFLTYLLEVPSHHPIVGHRFLWLSEYEMWMSISIIASALAIIAIKSRWEKSKIQALTWTLAVVGFALLSTLDVGFFPKLAGSSKNGMVPFAILVWVLGLFSWINKGTFSKFYRVAQSPRESSQQYWWWVVSVLVVFSTLMRGHHGGFTNVLMPGIWGLCVLIPLVAVQNRSSRQNIWVGVLIVQVLYGIWKPSQFIPTEEDRQAGDELVAMLSEESGPIFAPHSPWLPVLAGHPPTTHLIALWDIDHIESPLVSYVDRIKEDINNQRWSVIISANRKLGFGLLQSYRFEKIIKPKNNALTPPIGWKVRPSYLYVPKNVPKNP